VAFLWWIFAPILVDLATFIAVPFGDLVNCTKIALVSWVRARQLAMHLQCIEMTLVYPSYDNGRDDDVEDDVDV
jgi:hypothetical protein